MATDTVKIAVKLIGKGLGTIALAGAGAIFAAYALRHFPGWAFALSLLLSVCASIPMVLFFNLFPSSRDTVPKRYELQKHDDDWGDLFSPWHRTDDNDPRND